MTKAPPRNILVITLLAVALHALLFVAVQPGRVNAGRRAGKAPETYYMAQHSCPAHLSGMAVRVMNSPVLFSLPSGMGFSRELRENDVSTRLNTFSRPEQTERFLPADAASLRSSGRFGSTEFMVEPMTAKAPVLPSGIYVTEFKQPAARRVTIAPELKERLLGGVLLPQELNQPVSKAWEAKASVRVSENGVVEHVFFDEALEPKLNIQLLRLLYGLRFKSGSAVEGRIEIYSPESSANVEANP